MFVIWVNWPYKKTKTYLFNDCVETLNTKSSSTDQTCYFTFWPYVLHSIRMFGRSVKAAQGGIFILPKCWRNKITTNQLSLQSVWVFFHYFSFLSFCGHIIKSSYLCYCLWVKTFNLQMTTFMEFRKCKCLFKIIQRILKGFKWPQMVEHL